MAAKRNSARAASTEKRGQAPVRLAWSAPAASRLNKLVHERIRLGILSALAVNPVLSFSELKTILEASDGNLSVHARKLESAGYIECEKTFEKRVPKTLFRITQAGRDALGHYLDHMEALIRATR